MPAQRTFGMDHPHHEWSPIISRPSLRWPENAPVAPVDVQRKGPD